VSCIGAQLHPDVCTGSGACNTTGAACSGGYLCASTTACATSCGTIAGQTGCQGSYYCDGLNAGTCHSKLGTGASCTQNYQCTFGLCTSNICN
jgi:hypothetical protein